MKNKRPCFSLSGYPRSPPLILSRGPKIKRGGGIVVVRVTSGIDGPNTRPMLLETKHPGYLMLLESFRSSLTSIFFTPLHYRSLQTLNR